MTRFLANLGKLANFTRKGLSYLRRDPQSTLCLIRLSFWVLAVSILVKVLSLSRALRVISPRAKRSPKSKVIKSQNLTPTQLAALLDRLLRADFWVFTPTCWKRAAVLHRFLMLDGIETRIVFGVRKAGESLLSGHSWLEADGKPLLELQPPDYTTVYIFPE